MRPRDLPGNYSALQNDRPLLEIEQDFFVCTTVHFDV